MKWPYGYIRRTQATDGEHVDCYVGPNERAKYVYVVHQMKAPDFNKYDEDKCMLGFLSDNAARTAYLAHYNDKRFLGSIDAIPYEEFRMQQELKTIKAYDKAIDEARKRGSITEQHAKKLQIGIRSSDYETQRRMFREVRGFAVGPDADLIKALARAKAENMPEGRGRQIALAGVTRDEVLAKLDEQAKGATQADRRVIVALAMEINRAFRKKVWDINVDWAEKRKKEMEAQAKKNFAKPERPELDSLAQVGLFTR